MSPTRPSADEESIAAEVAYIEAFLGDRPAAAPIVLRRLGTLGVEGRADLPRLMAERTVKPAEVRGLQRARAGQAATRVAAAAVLIAGVPTVEALPAGAVEVQPLTGQPPAATTPKQAEASAPTLQAAVPKR